MPHGVDGAATEPSAIRRASGVSRDFVTYANVDAWLLGEQVDAASTVGVAGRVGYVVRVAFEPKRAALFALTANREAMNAHALDVGRAGVDAVADDVDVPRRAPGRAERVVVDDDRRTTRVLGVLVHDGLAVG